MGGQQKKTQAVGRAKAAPYAGAALMVLLWVGAGAAILTYAEHYKLMDRGWQIQYAVVVTLLLIVASFVAALAVAVLKRLLPAQFQRPGFAAVNSIFFVLFVAMFFIEEYPKAKVAKAERDELEYWQQQTEYQACLKARLRQTLHTRIAEAECKRLFSRGGI